MLLNSFWLRVKTNGIRGSRLCICIFAWNSLFSSTFAPGISRDRRTYPNLSDFPYLSSIRYFTEVKISSYFGDPGKNLLRSEKAPCHRKLPQSFNALAIEVSFLSFFQLPWENHNRLNSTYPPPGTDHVLS